MYQHLGIKLNEGIPSPPITPPSTQNAAASGSGSNAHSSSSARPAPSSTRATTAPRPPAQTGPAQSSASQSTHQSIPQQTHSSAARVAQPTAPNSAPLVAQPTAVPPAPAQPQAIPAPADEIAALRARIAELERRNARGNQFPARAPAPQQALVADPAEVDRICANLAGVKDEPKWLVLPALQPGHKFSALSLPLPLKVEEAFKSYRYVPYTALTHAARSKAFLRGEDSSFVLRQDGLTARGLDRANELSIVTVDWIAAAKAAEDRTLQCPETAALILTLPLGGVAATFDVSSAYRIIPVLPSQQNALCIFWIGIVYVDRALMFGLTSSAGVSDSAGNFRDAVCKPHRHIIIIEIRHLVLYSNASVLSVAVKMMRMAVGISCTFRLS
ncbi:hypothetical protein P692DRAFT_20870458 [Suillus brevipes Sb2]|nr:hypothetical protein P692DRAFT_20870458 [Suillus brevipes Sb2]